MQWTCKHCSYETKDLQETVRTQLAEFCPECGRNSCCPECGRNSWKTVLPAPATLTEADVRRIVRDECARMREQWEVVNAGRAPMLR